MASFSEHAPSHPPSSDAIEKILDGLNVVLEARDQKIFQKLEEMAWLLQQQEEHVKKMNESGACRGSVSRGSGHPRETHLRSIHRSDTTPTADDSKRHDGDSGWHVVLFDGLPTVRKNADNAVAATSCWLRTQLSQITNTSHFDMFWLLIITMNALFMGAELEYYVQTGTYHWSNTPGEFAFTALYAMEIFLRIASDGFRNYVWGPSWAWSFLDVSILAFSVADLVVSHFMDTQDDSSSDVSVLRILRLLRVLRVAKIIRGIRFLRNLRLLIVGMISSVMSIAWTVITLAFLIYVGAVIIVTVASDKVIEGSAYYVDHWGDMFRSMGTLFQVMTGDSWWSVIVSGIRPDYPGIELLFLAYYSFTAYGLLNIVTGIFVEQTLSASLNDADVMRDRMDESRSGVKTFLQDMFKIMDVTRDGVVDYREFTDFLNDPQVKFALEHIGVKVEEVRNLFDLLDKSGDGEIEIKEFVDGCMKMRMAVTTADLIEVGISTRRLLISMWDDVKEIRAALPHSECMSI